MKYFGTDGIRGIANAELTPDLAYRTGLAMATALLGNAEGRSKVFIGSDTRISGNMLECALAAGICAAGADVYFLGVLPTPAIAYLTVKHNAQAGVVISASHNPFEHNGIKIFGGNGFKLSDETENLIEELMHDDYVQYKNCHIARSKLLYDSSDTLIKEISIIDKLNDLGYEVYLLPNGYARDRMNCYLMSAD